MNDEQFEALVSNIAPENVQAYLRARDLAQREDIKRLESSLAHACVLLGEADYQARLWEDYQTENEMEVEDHWVTSQVRDRIYKFLDGFKVAELVRSTYSFPRLVSWSEQMSTCTLVFKEREYYFDLSDDCKDDDAQADQQEARGAQAGDDERQAALREMFQISYAGDIWQILGRLYDAGYRRAALATQAAAGELVATVAGGGYATNVSAEIDRLLPVGTKLYTAPSAAAHGDEAVRKLVLPTPEQVMNVVMKFQWEDRKNGTGTTNWAANLGMTVVEYVARLNADAASGPAVSLSDAEHWTEREVAEFLAIALRHVAVKGSIDPQDIRDAFRVMREQAAMRAQGDGGEA